MYNLYEVGPVAWLAGVLASARPFYTRKHSSIYMASLARFNKALPHPSFEMKAELSAKLIYVYFFIFLDYSSGAGAASF